MERSPAGRLVELLQKRKMTITTAESCTGGGISSALVDIPGASDVLRMAFVTYCDEAKAGLLGVREETLRNYTAVSAHTAAEMAIGARERAEADIALASTGIAGPGGTAEFPAGLVFLACACGKNVTVKEYHFAGSRNEVRRQAVEKALQMGLNAVENS